MRWLDIDLCRENENILATSFLERAHARAAEIGDLQRRYGLDGPQTLSGLEETGQLLFRAVRAVDQTAFALERANGDRPDSTTDEAEPADIGYHLIVDDAHLNLPWTALHNGIRFLIESAPICVSTQASSPAPDNDQRQWMRRWRDDVFTEAALGPASVGELVRRYRPEACAEPGILFLDGQGDTGGGSHGLMEREMLSGALETRRDGARLARLEAPQPPLTPARLARNGHGYKIFHFSGSTAVASSGPAAAKALPDWEAFTAPDPTAEEGELEVVGVDQVTALLDHINERADQGQLAPWSTHGSAQAVAEVAPCWLLEDGPVRPEDLARQQATPPMIFSNSYLSLTTLGARFLHAGASVFVGPQLAVSPAHAREFAAEFYHALALGNSAAASVRTAALTCRDRWGAHHPAWLAYGILGSGALALQYL